MKGGLRDMEDRMRKSKYISTQNSRRKEQREQKKVLFEEMITKNFPETMEEQVFTDAWPTAYTTKDKCADPKKMHLHIP